ncbi:hypothetical protein D3C78_1400440 [compost metagenome]
MLRGLDGNDITQLAFGLRGAQIAVERGITQDQTNEQPLVTVLVEQPGEFEAFLDADDDGFFREDGAAGLKPDADMFKMHMVRRADH